MRRSKSEVVRILSGVGCALALGGCDAIGVPVPDARERGARGILTGFVVDGPGFVGLRVSRPAVSVDEMTQGYPWFDASRSEISIETGDGRTRPIGGGQESDFSVWFSRQESSGVGRVKGRIRWNASVPYSSSEDSWIVETFDVVPEASPRVRFDRNSVRGSVHLRWPKLAWSPGDSLRKWASVPDSLRSFLDDWYALCASRGEPTGRMLVLDSTASGKAYRWRLPDTGDMRRILSGRDPDAEQTVFRGGDTIWGASDAQVRLYVGLRDSGGSVLLFHALRRQASGRLFVDPFWTPEAPILPAGVVVSTGVFSIEPHYRPTSDLSYRTILQVSGTCPAFEKWRRWGSTAPWERPNGNVGPFDGYLCRLVPDTISFPEGDVVPTGAVPGNAAPKAGQISPAIVAPGG